MDKELIAAITALLTTGVLLLSTGSSYIKTGDFQTGVPLIIIGAALILAATFLTTLLAQNAARSYQAESCKQEPCCNPPHK